MNFFFFFEGWISGLNWCRPPLFDSFLPSFLFFLFSFPLNVFLDQKIRHTHYKTSFQKMGCNNLNSSVSVNNAIGVRLKKIGCTLVHKDFSVQKCSYLYPSGSRAACRAPSAPSFTVTECCRGILKPWYFATGDYTPFSQTLGVLNNGFR